MNPNATISAIETKLKAAVERAVRPVASTHARKQALREELLAHLTGVFDEELAILGDAQEACQRTLTRFGDPRAISRELQDSIPRWNRLVGRIEYVPRRSDMTPLGVLRAMLLLTSLLYVLLLAIHGLLTWLHVGRDQSGFLFFTGVMFLSSVVFMFPFQLVSEKLGRWSLEERSALGWRPVGLFLVAGACFPLWFMAIYAGGVGDLASDWRVLWPLWCAGLLLGPLLAVVNGRGFVRLKQHLIEWDWLEIDG